MPIQTDPIPESAQEAISALQRGDKLQARSLLEQALADHPKDTRIWLWLSWAAETEEDRQRYLERLAELDPDNQSVQKWLSGQRSMTQQMVGSSALELLLSKTQQADERTKRSWRPTRQQRRIAGIGMVVLLVILVGWWFWQRVQIDADEVRQGYRPLLSLQVTLIAVEETAIQMEVDNAESLAPYLDRLINTKALVLKLHDDLDAETPPYPPDRFELAWQEAERAVPTFDDVLERWLNNEIAAINIPVELAPVRAQVDHALAIADEALAQRYGANRTQLNAIREEVLAEVRTDLQTPPAEAP